MAKFKGYRQTTLTSLLGPVIYERPYYHCPHCGTGCFPTDDELRIEDKKTKGAEEVISLAGVTDAFEESADKLVAKMSGLRLSASTVHRTVVTVGDRLAEERAAGRPVGPDTTWDWQRDAAGNRVAYVSLDATGVPQQGPHHEKAECRMAWVGCVFNPSNPQPAHKNKRRRMRDTRYVAGLMSLPEIGLQIRRECRATGIEHADTIVALTDGGAGLEDCLLDAVAGLSKNRIQFILDFYHVTEHVHEFAKFWIKDEEARRVQTDEWCHLLKHKGGHALLEALEALDLTAAKPDVTESHRLLTGYLRKNLHRTDYPEYIRQGWHIGSGVVESACKSVVARRMKGAGMRWRPDGTTAMCQLRALYKSKGNLWDCYWRTTVS